MDKLFQGTSKNDSEGAPYTRLWGGNGHDALRLEVAAKGILRGDGGDDILSVDPTIDYPRAVIYGGTGSDSIIGGASWEIAFGGRGDDYVTGGDDDDHLYGDGGRDALYGGAGNDYLYGGKGKDKGEITAPTAFKPKGKPDYGAFAGGLYGGEGDDLLNGGNGADFLFGGVGEDTIFGWRGKDKLYGGDGDDVFLYWAVKHSRPGKKDVIFDFAEGDRIELEDIDANHNKPGDQAFEFIDEAPFSGKAGQLRYSDGRLEGDVDGDKEADLIIKLANKAILDADDFIL